MEHAGPEEIDDEDMNTARKRKGKKKKNKITTVEVLPPTKRE